MSAMHQLFTHLVPNSPISKQPLKPCTALFAILFPSCSFDIRKDHATKSGTCTKGELQPEWCWCSNEAIYRAYLAGNGKWRSLGYCTCIQDEIGTSGKTLVMPMRTGLDYCGVGTFLIVNRSVVFYLYVKKMQSRSRRNFVPLTIAYTKIWVTNIIYPYPTLPYIPLFNLIFILGSGKKELRGSATE